MKSESILPHLQKFFFGPYRSWDKTILHYHTFCEIRNMEIYLDEQLGRSWEKRRAGGGKEGREKGICRLTFSSHPFPQLLFHLRLSFSIYFALLFSTPKQYKTTFNAIFYRLFLGGELKMATRRASCGKFRNRNFGTRRKTYFPEILKSEFLFSIQQETAKERGFEICFTFKISRSLSGGKYTVSFTLLPLFVNCNFVVCNTPRDQSWLIASVTVFSKKRNALLRTPLCGVRLGTKRCRP